ncbi:LOW QUALITY PROTEIN: uncharacterized protein LOC113367755 [Ctenocephalides felis]|uniref:LOW QUALITY PROTEIN: uncharacterized protein LOC113367755 n=1 Tax=Ctenocephalides felis TaxID=7515 RepID=UPI000E6E4C14|nr:LOW QUALITY PROTEIN: uncharacterized protein LOC113367755 [Ctenocephalides felis]
MEHGGDMYREIPFRFIGLSHEIMKRSFPIVWRAFPIGLILRNGYIAMDVFDKAQSKFDSDNMRPSIIAAGDAFIWQMMATVAIPWITLRGCSLTMGEELLTSSPAVPHAPHLRSAPSGADIRGGDLVSRLLAATPPYLYSAPAGAHSYFFSEMLRSLVRARETQRSASMATRRTRKRSWMPPTSAQHHNTNSIPETDRFSKKPSTIRSPDRPLELTTNIKPQHESTPSQNHLTKHTTENILRNSTSSEGAVKVTENQEHQQSDLILPPPPPMWYPPLYPPPYGVIDPLHFFIDLRVSGHVYDRNKKEQEQKLANVSTYSKMASDANNFAVGRHGSAFSVPLPRNNNNSNLNSNSKGAVNLSNDKNLYKKPDNGCNTNYVLQNLPRIYNDISTERKDATISVDDDDDEEQNGDSENENDKSKDEEQKKKDLRALIGLELVVDYVKKKEDDRKPNLDEVEEIPD